MVFRITYVAEITSTCLCPFHKKFLTIFNHFTGEVKNGKVIGFHNWLYFLLEEQKGNLNYYGFSKHFDFGQDGRYRGGILKSTFKWHGHKKPVS